MLLTCRCLYQGLGDSGFADASLTGKQNHLAFTISGLPPSFQQEAHLLVASDNRRDTASMSGSETALERALTEHGEGCSRTMDALEILCSEITKDEDISNQPPGRFSDDHRAGLGRTLQPCCQIGCVPDNSLLLRRAFTDKIPDHDQPGGDADAYLQCRSGRCT